MDIKIYYRDTDCGGVVYYANYLDYFEMARTEWMAGKGISVKELRETGVQFVVKNACLDYKIPAAYGDMLQINTVMSKVTGASITFEYSILVKGTGKCAVTGETKLVCIDMDMRPRKLPDDVRAKLTS